ncbi:MAG: ribonucleoside-triphosphate reductase, adenosylcobalamin-dependent [Pseudanabaena sp. ELA607]
MVQEIQRPQPVTSFPESAPTAYPVFFRTYSRKIGGVRESWSEVCARTLQGLCDLGQLTSDQAQLIHKMQTQLKALTSGRWLWVGGTAWSKQPENYSGAYNCTSTNVVDWHAFGLMMDLAMQGCGTGAVLEPQHIAQLPVIRNHLVVELVGEIGQTPSEARNSEATITHDIAANALYIKVGDSRQGWVSSYQALLEASSDERFDTTQPVTVRVDITDVRPAGEALKGFGGVANPVKLPELYFRCANILNKALGRKLNSVECCLLIDEAAVVIVAGNVRRSAGMRQFHETDSLGAVAKDNLWQQGEDGSWRIDPERDALRMANHTRVFHHKPSLDECIAAVTKQYYSGEGAIQYAPEAIARANADLLTNPTLKREFLAIYEQGVDHAKNWLRSRYPDLSERELEHRLQRYGLNPCGEIIGSNFFCNLAEVHLNQLDPQDMTAQEEAFTAGALSVAVLLNHQFQEERYHYSRAIDPIVGVSFTGLFDFFVTAFGMPWLRWWEAGRPATLEGQAFKAKEQAYLNRWRDIVHQTVWAYCDKHNLHRPNRCTTVQPSGTKSLLTGASPGWHPPKAQRFLRRITFRKNDPVALACLDYGYSVIPSQSDKDENGNLLNDPFDPRCTEWLVEIPVQVSWANLSGADTVEIAQFNALAQFDFYMQVQKHYTTHNTSSTIELREHEIQPLAAVIHSTIQNDEGYISSALLARFDDLQTFPRLPFEPIDKATYETEVIKMHQRRRISDFQTALMKYDQGLLVEAGPAGCDSDKCLMPEQAPSS